VRTRKLNSDGLYDEGEIAEQREAVRHESGSGFDILARSPQAAPARTALARQYDDAEGLARLRQARAERDRRRYVPPQNDYAMAGLRLQAEAEGRDFASAKHPPGTTSRRATSWAAALRPTSGWPGDWP
jgi:hypothetical protein